MNEHYECKIASLAEMEKQWDYLISPSKYVTDILRSSFTYEGEILEEGN